MSVYLSGLIRSAGRRDEEPFHNFQPLLFLLKNCQAELPRLCNHPAGGAI